MVERATLQQQSVSQTAATSSVSMMLVVHAAESFLPDKKCDILSDPNPTTPTVQF